MARQLKARTARFALNQSNPESLKDMLSGGVPKIPRGDGFRMQCAIFEADPGDAGNLIDDPSTIASVTLVCRKEDAAGDFLFEKVIGLADFDNAAMTYEQWLARTSQQFTFVLGDLETNQDFEEGQLTMPVYFAIEAQIVGLPPALLGSFKTTIVEDGIGTAGTPVAGDPAYLTAAQSYAAFLQIGNLLSEIAALGVGAQMMARTALGFPEPLLRFRASDGTPQIYDATADAWYPFWVATLDGARTIAVGDAEAPGSYLPPVNAGIRFDVAGYPQLRNPVASTWHPLRVAVLGDGVALGLGDAEAAGTVDIPANARWRYTLTGGIELPLSTGTTWHLLSVAALGDGRALTLST